MMVGQENFGNMMVQMVGKQTLIGKIVGIMPQKTQVYLTMAQNIQQIQNCIMVRNHFMTLRLQIYQVKITFVL